VKKVYSDYWEEWVAEKDFKTCVACRTLDGKIIGIDMPFIKPPLHENCRCRIEKMEVVSEKDAEDYIDTILATDRTVYNNFAGKLPDAPWRIWYEADKTNLVESDKTTKILYSSDGLIFVTRDDYKSFVEVSGGWNHIDDLPANVVNAYTAYEVHGWKGNFAGQTPGTNAGRSWGNTINQLPTTDSSGNPITYREFDVNNRIPGADRDAERFVVGSDGSIYYTDSHYGQSSSPSGLPDFIKIK